MILGCFSMGAERVAAATVLFTRAVDVDEHLQVWGGVCEEEEEQGEGEDRMGSGPRGGWVVKHKGMKGLRSGWGGEPGWGGRQEKGGRWAVGGGGRLGRGARTGREARKAEDGQRKGGGEVEQG